MKAPERSGRKTSKQAFFETMKNHPERLKGKSVEEAYAGMRREVERRESGAKYNRGSRNNESITTIRKTSPVSPNAIERRVTRSSAPVKDKYRSDAHYPVNEDLGRKNHGGISNPLAYKNGQTPVQRMQKRIGSFNNANEAKLQKLHDQMVRTGNPFANKNGMTPLQRMGIGAPPKRKKK